MGLVGLVQIDCHIGSMLHLNCSQRMAHHRKTGQLFTIRVFNDFEAKPYEQIDFLFHFGVYNSEEASGT